MIMRIVNYIGLYIDEAPYLERACDVFDQTPEEEIDGLKDLVSESYYSS